MKIPILKEFPKNNPLNNFFLVKVAHNEFFCGGNTHLRKHGGKKKSFFRSLKLFFEAIFYL